jgi:hypothetical protein
MYLKRLYNDDQELSCKCDADEVKEFTEYLSSQDIGTNTCLLCCEYGIERKPIDCVKERFCDATGRLRISFENV